MKRLIVLAITVYQKTLSPDHGLARLFFPRGLCRHYPTCSVYTKEAVIRRGSLFGVWLGMKRVARCNPWNVGGFDPVPK